MLRVESPLGLAASPFWGLHGTALRKAVPLTPMKMQPVCSPFLPSFEPFCFAAPLDENDLEEDVDSEPAEIEGEAAEDGDPGDTGAELDDDQHWSDSPSDADRELHLRHAAEGAAEPELRVSEDEEKLPASPKHQERGEPVIDGRDNFKNSCKSRVHRRVAQGPGASEESHGARQPPRCRELLAFSCSVHPPCATGCCRCFGQWPFPCVLWVWEKVEGLS